MSAVAESLARAMRDVRDWEQYRYSPLAMRVGRELPPRARDGADNGLPALWRATFDETRAIRSGHRALVLVVWSYGTPIAWRGSGNWIVPQFGASRTTERHQRLTRRALWIGGEPIGVLEYGATVSGEPYVKEWRGTAGRAYARNPRDGS